MIYYNERWATLRWDETCQAVYIEWKGYAEEDNFRKPLEMGLNLLQTKRSSRWLADTRLMGPMRQIDQTWTNEDWMPRAMAAGLRWSAIIHPQSAIARLSMKQLMSRINEAELVTANFEDLESARAWLRNPTKRP